uniref:Cytochrome c-553 n=1 Tax=Alsidium seaforthii TaxID=2007182 RepID=A0A1Z1MDL4_9FLOR|nr:cytochrome c553 [Bryothamnion seaforthii]ARW63844.1 cytochrome c553 [Bryothamnion seaforthii]
MKFFLSLLSIFSIILSFNFDLVYGQEIDLDDGAQVFSQRCTACHSGGNNAINPDKTLKIDALEKYEKDNVDAIILQVTNGKAEGGMPAFGDILSKDQIQNVANYVLNQAKNQSW